MQLSCACLPLARALACQLLVTGQLSDRPARCRPTLASTPRELYQRFYDAFEMWGEPNIVYDRAMMQVGGQAVLAASTAAGARCRECRMAGPPPARRSPTPPHPPSPQQQSPEFFSLLDRLKTYADVHHRDHWVQVGGWVGAC